MNPTNITQILWSNLIAVSGADTLASLISSTIKEQTNSDIQDMLAVIVSSELEGEKLQRIIEVLEAAYVDGTEVDLAPFLAVLLHNAGTDYLARYYAGLSLTIPEYLSEKMEWVSEYQSAERRYRSSCKIQDYNFTRKYVYHGEQKQYSVHSFSSEIGKNATVIKTPYGAIMFDCGAACGLEHTDVITEIEMLEFFMRIDISPDDLLAVVISHAHLDHYGSIATLLNLGIGFDRIYIEDETKALIQQVATGIPSLAEAMPINAFFVPFQRVKITAFSNGHILGSTGYIVSFDERNVIYTGDYCLHSQQTVDGLSIDKLRHNKEIACNGVDCLITETTYGKKSAPIAYSDVSKVFSHFVDLLLAQGYKVFIPSFAIGRSQEIALLLNESHSILIDGLAAKISKIYEQVAGIKVFNGNTRYNENFDENKEDNFDVNDVIIASSGMLSQNSTSYNYVKGFLESDRRIAIIKTGYISSESYGNELLKSWKGKNNRLFDISLSAHADFNEILDLIVALNPKNIVCIHGDGLKDCIDFEEDAADENESAIDEQLSAMPANEKSDTTEESETADTVSTITQEENNNDVAGEKSEKPSANPMVVSEILRHSNTRVIELIHAHLAAYRATPKGYRTNGPSSRNENMYKTYNDLYSYARMNSQCSALYNDLFEIGPKRSKSYSYLVLLSNALDSERAGCEEKADEMATEPDGTSVIESTQPKERTDTEGNATCMNLTNEAEAVEEPQWTESSILYVHKGTIICQRDHHNVVSATAVLLGRFDKDIELTVNYCRDCKRFFINYISYETYKHRYGVLIGNIVMEDEGKNIFGDVYLADASPLKLCGYSVSQQDGYTSQMRQYIIAKIIDRGIMSKSDIVKYLEYFISINGKQKRNHLALEKWKEDLTFTLGYEADRQERHHITEIKRYR